MTVTARPSDRGPMSEMNTTPLIDVLLVLLVMLIITVPISTHSLDVDLPTTGEDGPSLTKNSLILRASGRLEWNGRPVSDAQLAGQLMLVRGMNPEPEVRFEPEANASYERSAQVMLIVKQSRVSNFGFAGNERYRTFGRR
jgi:biopolymer transport protein ExbD